MKVLSRYMTELSISRFWSETLKTVIERIQELETSNSRLKGSGSVYAYGNAVSP